MTAVTLSGAGGVSVTVGVEVEIRLGHVGATILPHKMVEKIAADWANLQKHGNAMFMDAQV